MADPNPGVYEPGQNITVYTSAAVTSKTFVAITGNRQSGLSNNITVGPATAAGRIAGVAAQDIAINKHGTIHRGGGRVTYVTAGGTIAAGAEVEVGAGGTAVTLSAGKAVGYAVTGATSGNDAEISLYY